MDAQCVHRKSRTTSRGGLVSVMPKPALPWLKRFCALYAKHDRSVYAWEVEPHISGILVSLTLDRGTVHLLIHKKGQSASYAETESMALSIHRPEGADPMPGNGELVVRQFLQVLRRADKGDIELPEGGTAQNADSMPLLDPDQVAEVHEQLSDEIHWAQFLAYKAIITEDLYPHVGPLGKLVSTSDIKDGWKDTVARIQRNDAPQKLGLYVHIPFCTVACTFCYCGKTDNFDKSGMNSYLENLIAEARDFGPIFDGCTFTSVYFGGGTPSLLSPPAMKQVFEAIYTSFSVPDGTQVIYEGNPDSLSERKIQVLAQQGKVTRLTIGVQTLDDRVQQIVRRHNRPEHVREAIKAARKYGISHVNCDLMAGMPEQSMESFQQDVRFLLELEPDSIHLNGFRPLPRTRLGTSGTGMTPERIALRAEMLEWATEALSEAGHASAMGQGPRRTRNAANLQEYDLRRQNSSLLGLGFPSRAHSFGNHYYSPDVSEGFDPSLNKDIAGNRRWRAIRSDDTEEMHKYLVSNLRTGFTRTEFKSIFGTDPIAAAPEAFRKLEALGVVFPSEDDIYCRTETAADDLIYRTFFYSADQHERAKEVWGHEYDKSQDYRSKLDELVESCG